MTEAAPAGDTQDCRECRDFYSGVPTPKHDLELGCAPDCPCRHEHDDTKRVLPAEAKLAAIRNVLADLGQFPLTVAEAVEKINAILDGPARD